MMATRTEVTCSFYCLGVLAERVGFEPTLEFPLNTLSKRAPSATRPSLRRDFVNSADLFYQGRGQDIWDLGIRISDFPTARRLLTSLNPKSRILNPKSLLILKLLFLFRLFSHPLGQIVLDTHFVDGVELGFEPVDMVFFL